MVSLYVLTHPNLGTVVIYVQVLDPCSGLVEY